MATKNFSQFTQESSPTLSQFLVGYDTAVSGGERRFQLTDVLGLVADQIIGTASGILKADGLGNVTATTIGTSLSFSGGTLDAVQGIRTSDSPTFANPTVTSLNLGATTPGVIGGSSGAITLTAAGTNQNITITPSGTGTVAIGSSTGANGALAEFRLNGASTPASGWYGTASIITALGETTAGNSDFGLGFASGSNGGNRASFSFKKSRGTLAVPTTVVAGDTVGSFGFGAFDGTNFLNSAFVSSTVDSQLAVSPGVAGQRIGFFMGVIGTGSRTETVAVRMNGTLTPGFSSKTIAAWTTSGAHLAVGGNTVTDNSSSGTVATAVASSFAVPTFAASSATTFTDFANGYWAGAPSRGTNVTGGNPWCGWFASGGGGGNVRIDGSLYFGGVSGTVLAGSTTTTSLTGGAGNMTITAGTGNSRTLTLQTTTSGGTATTALSINATQDVAHAGAATFAGSTSAANGQSLNIKSLTELTTIAAAATTTTTIQLPANAIILSVSVRVTTVIPTATSFSVGDSGSATRFNTANVGVAANSTDVGTKAGAYYNASATGVLLTMNGGTPASNTGRVRVTIAYLDVTVPTS